jgi:hypothetical protein
MAIDAPVQPKADTYAAGPQPARPAPASDDDFAALLLQALSAMAGRSKRRQADLTAALRGANLEAEPARVRAALRILQSQGCIENLCRCPTAVCCCP